MSPYEAPKKPGRRPGGLTDAAVTGIDLEALGSAEVLEIAQIKVDPAYQRDLRHDLVNQIAQDYDIVKAGPILVSARKNGDLWCVDGQHRIAGALQAGETEIFAHVVHNLTQAKEAELRLARNDRRSDTIQEKFRSRLVMGDKKAHAMVELVRQQGSDINLSPTGSHGINAIATTELLYDVDGKGVWLARTLRCIREAFGDDNMNPDTCSTSMLKAVAWFLSQHVDSREANYDEFVSRLGSLGVDDIRRKAVSHKAANGGSLWLNYYRGLIELWNFRRQEKNMLRWKTIGSIHQLGAEGTRTSGWERNRDKVGSVWA